MTRLYADTDKFSRGNASAVVEAFHGAIHERVRTRLQAAGGEWASFATETSLALITGEDFRAVETLLLEAGHRFAWSAAISPRERPDAYVAAAGADEASLATFSFEHAEAITAPADARGREQRGQGDNVARYAEDRTGIARYIRTPAQVLKYVQEGVPANTIAIIDDSGGTLTAPILVRFTGVICAGGTTRSHLGILTREYRVPCLMNAKISGIRHGDTVCIETTAQPKTADDYQAGRETTARVWRITK